MPRRASEIVGKAIRQARRQRRLSQTALAELAALDRVYVARLERGIRSPSLDALVRIARVLRVNAATLLEGLTPAVLDELELDTESAESGLLHR
jgi:transcriptional regulator with XRE-family HTH domain